MHIGEKESPQGMPKRKADVETVATSIERSPIAEVVLDEGKNHVKICSWNVAGLRGSLKKCPSILNDLVAKYQFDILTLQETKLQEAHVTDEIVNLLADEGFSSHWCCSVDKKGYSGTCVFIRSNAAKASKADSKTLAAMWSKDKKAKSADDTTTSNLGHSSDRLRLVKALDIVKELQIKDFRARAEL